MTDRSECRKYSYRESIHNGDTFSKKLLAEYSKNICRTNTNSRKYVVNEVRVFIMGISYVSIYVVNIS